MINKYILPFKNKFTKVIMYICIGIIFLWYSMTSGGGIPHIKAIGILFIFIAISSHGRNGLTHSLTGYDYVFCYSEDTLVIYIIYTI